MLTVSCVKPEDGMTSESKDRLNGEANEITITLRYRGTIFVVSLDLNSLRLYG